MRAFFILSLLVAGAAAARFPSAAEIVAIGLNEAKHISQHSFKAEVIDTKYVEVDATSHYGNPASGCESDEKAVQVQGIAGDFCSPSCSSTTPCPTDVPAGTTVKPQCALEVSGSSQPTMCALLCSILSFSHGCPTGATCQHVQGITGICTYPTSN